MHWQWNDIEEDALMGLPWLARVLYIHGLRRHMDYGTGVVGLKRGISYQSLREVAYVEPEHGRRNASHTTLKTVRVALRQLMCAGLIERLPAERRLVFRCPLAVRDSSAPNNQGRERAEEGQTHPDRSEPSNGAVSDASRGRQRADPETPHQGNPPYTEYPKEEKSASHSCRAAPDVGERQDDAAGPDDAVAEVIAHLNARTDSAFKSRLNGKPTRAAELVRARLREHGKAALLAVIERKTAEWKDDDRMSRYLRPATLFGREKCEQYVGQLSVPLRVKHDRKAEIEAWVNGGEGNVIEGVFRREST